jgi:predicted GNAT superfamily acetyltransferase
MRLRELTTIDEFRQVVALEHEVWGYTTSEDAVPVPMLIVSVKIGGLVIGAFDQNGRLVGFAYSLPGIENGRPFHWSHMLGVARDFRDQGVGLALKLEQRRLALARGLDLIEWTYDPLQALNAHLNFVKLGVVVRRYERDVYGESSSPLHRGTATDRFIAEWWLRSESVVTRTGGVRPCAAPGSSLPAHRSDGAQGSSLAVLLVNEVRAAGEWLAPVRANLALDADRLGVVIPTGFTEMQQQDLPLARAWRAATREVFEAYLPSGYEVAGFTLDRVARRGTYLLSRKPHR